MLDVIARARENANWDQLLSPWSPSVLGLPRQPTLDNLLGLLTIVTGDPVWTVKLILFGGLLEAGSFTYLLVWKWYGSVFPAAMAGVLYMSSQASLGRVASGWPHYELLIATTPLLVYLWVECVDRFSLARAIAFALVLSGVTFVRQDLILWVLPYLALYVPIRLYLSDRPREILANLFATVRVVIPAVMVLSSYLILPAMVGIHSPWLTANQLFAVVRFNLVDRSLGAYHSLLGFGRDLGYLPFSGQEWWNFHPYMPQSVYYATASLLVLLAYGAIWRYRDRRTIFLLTCAVVATFLGKGIRDPLGGPYLWSVDNVPVFGNLRGPNRWLIVQALAYSALAALTINWTASRLKTLRSPIRRFPKAPLYAGIGVLMIAVLLPVAPTLLSGFATWRPEAGQVALMKTVEHDRGDFYLSSVPYNQFMRFFVQGSHRGYEHDIGTDSTIFTGHSAISGATWDRTTPDFVSFTSSLLKARDPAFTELLGAIGTKYLLKFNYPVSAPDLVTEGNGNPYYQQQAVQSMSGLDPIQQTNGGTLYRMQSNAPLMSFRSNIAVVLGGRAGLAALADMPNINLPDWATFTADDVLSSQHGRPLDTLLNLIRASNLVLLSNETLQDITVLASPPVTQVPGITSNSGVDRKTGLLLTDESLRRGSLADQRFPPPALTPAATRTFHLNRPRYLELWTRILSGPTPGNVRFVLDGRQIGDLIPLAPAKGGFRWVRVAAQVFRPGDHTLHVVGGHSNLGGSFEVDETRLIDPTVRSAALNQLSAALHAVRRKVAYSLDLASLTYQNVRYGADSQPIGSPLSDSPGRFWHIREPSKVQSAISRGSEGSRSVFLTEPRTFYTFVQHVFPKPQDWRSRGFGMLRYRGTGDGRTYDLLVDFDYDHKSSTSFKIFDRQPGWHTAIFTVNPKRGDWSHVVSVRLATRTKETTGALELGPMGFMLPRNVSLTYPLVGDAAGRAAFFNVPSAGPNTRRLLSVPRGSNALQATLPLRVVKTNPRLTIPPLQAPEAHPAVPVSFRSSGVAKYDFSFNSPRWGVLVFNRKYDDKWRARASGLGYPLQVPESSLVNAFFFGPGPHSGTIDFAGRGAAITGIALSVLALIVLLVVGLLWHLRGIRRPGTARWERTAWQATASRPVVVDWRSDEFWQQKEHLIWISTGIVASALVAAAFSFVVAAAIVLVGVWKLRPQWQLPWWWAVGFICVMPLYTAIGRSDVNENVAVVVVICMALAVLLLLREERSRRSASARAARTTSA
jgi:hypothetical protein